MTDQAHISFGLSWPGWRWWFARFMRVWSRGDRRAVRLGLYAWWLWRHGEADRV